MNDGVHLDPAQQHSDRSSLSPPPPITLRLGMKQAIAERAAYSSSSDEDGPPSMKARTSPSKRFHPPAFEDPSMPAQHRTSYDWLQPSFAAASHHGPPERIMPEIMSWSPSDEGEGKDGKGKKSHKRRPDNAPPGPGKAWRKGLKKWVLPRAMIADGRGMPIPWREGGAFLGDLCPAYPIGTLPGQATPRSQEGTPEPGECIA